MALVRADNVLCHKEAGLLELSTEALTWTPSTPGGEPVRFLVGEVKSTLMSKRSASRAMLKVVLLGRSDVVFDFTPASRDAEEPWTLREMVRDALHNLRTPDVQAGFVEPPAQGAGSAQVGQPVAAGAVASLAAPACAPAIAHAQPPPGAGLVPQAAGGARDPLLEAEALRQKRQLILQRDPPLRRLYDELVVTGVVPEADFWLQHSTDEARHALAVQRDGPASRLPGADEVIDLRKKELKIKLTPALITQIFFDAPKVRALYEKTVPHKWTEQEFWQRYFKHKHFHATQAAGRGGGGGAGGKVAPADDRDADAQELLRTVRAEGDSESVAEAETARRRRQAALAATVNPAHDLRLLEFESADVHALGDGGGSGGAGWAGAGGSGGGAERPARGATDGGFGSVAWTDTLKRPAEARANRARFRQAIQPYLRHSEQVMAHVSAAAAGEGGGGGEHGADESCVRGAHAETAATLQARKRALEASATDGDLEVREAPQFQQRPQVARRAGGAGGGAAESAPAAGAGARGPGGGAPRPLSAEEELAARDALAVMHGEWGSAPDVLARPSPTAARNVLAEVEWEEEEAVGPGPPGSAASGRAGQSGQLSGLPEQLQLAERQVRVHELLRHFWGCLNPRTDGTDGKLQRLREPLRRHYDELLALKDALPADERKPLVAAAIALLITMIERTFAVAPSQAAG